MMKYLVLATLIAGSPTPYEQALEAAGSGDYEQAAELFSKLVRSPPPELDRGGLVLAAANSYRLHHEHTGSVRSVCEGHRLLRGYIVDTHDTAAEIAALYWTFVDLADALDCEPQPKLPSPPTSEPAKPAAIESRAPTTVIDLPTQDRETPSVAIESPAIPTTVIDLPTQDRETPSPRPRPKFTAGVVATSLAGAGVLALAAESIVFHRRFVTYRDTPGHDEHLYQQTKAAQRVMVGTGIATCVALTTGITLLAIDQRERKLSVRPGLAGFALQGLF